MEKTRGETIGDRLKALRDERGLSQAQAASELNVPPASLARRENSGSVKSKDLLPYKERWSVNLHWLITGEGQRQLNANGSGLVAIRWARPGAGESVDARLPEWVVPRDTRVAIAHVDRPNPTELIEQNDWAIYSQEHRDDKPTREGLLYLFRQYGYLGVRRVVDAGDGTIVTTDALGSASISIRAAGWPEGLKLIGRVIAVIRRCA